MSFLSGIRGDDSNSGFDPRDSFVTERLPDPGEFLDGYEVLTGREHATFHRLTQSLFDERGVYDVTFGYNLARLNQDHRHPDAGFRYAREVEDANVLRAEFTPTTAFCPQSDTLMTGAFRAWNGLDDRHEYDLVRVRVASMHHQHESINEKLRDFETQFRDTGQVPDETTGSDPGRESSEAQNDIPF